MNVKGLVHRELSEGMTEAELASAIGVSVRTIADILVDKLPQDSAIWEQFAQYFRIHSDFLRYGGPLESEGLFELSERTHFSPLGQMRRVPLLRWDQIDQMVTRDEPPRLIHAATLLETDVSGKRTFALQVRDNSMRPLFSVSLSETKDRRLKLVTQMNRFGDPTRPIQRPPSFIAGDLFGPWSPAGKPCFMPSTDVFDLIQIDKRCPFQIGKDISF